MAKLSKKYAQVFKAITELVSVLEDQESEADREIAPNRALTISYNHSPQALKVEGWGKRFASRLDDFDG